VKFRDGYAPDASEMLVEFRSIRREGKGRSAEYTVRLARIGKISHCVGLVLYLRSKVSA
jgi:hypothetical protein